MPTEEFEVEAKKNIDSAADILEVEVEETEPTVEDPTPSAEEPTTEPSEGDSGDDGVEVVDNEDASSDGEGGEVADFELEESAEDAPSDFEKDEDEEDDPEEEDEDEKKPCSEHSLEEFSELQAQVEALTAELESLREFKAQQDDLKKIALINKYHMLSDEDKAEVTAHRSEFSLEEIESKLALIYVQKNVDFSTLDGKAVEEEIEEEDPLMTFSLENETAEFVPPIVAALRQTNHK